ncbi:LOW QUALITY PROTEIN: ATP-dependent DNA helicase Q4 [Rhinatrema bivittatum]|uniref:LOW QUALITY PROTEIN: ATP-dependent DNA helicase Q4 n=1 Tax=Rhinatrema bivittatum TaxID=194408 RepID=UPI00112625D5|nr:LOW QUALITY PROTEIN: ATP-dependent DNA helicase Q4 [Rhinatrema bivittatum]
MERCTQLKVLLKNWEAAFLQQHKRKPNKTDVENAPSEIQNFYREYRILKLEDKPRRSPRRDSLQEQRAEEVPGSRDKSDSASWGPHLNRGNATPELTREERESLKASAQYFGMKIKSNVGASIKDRPMSLRKSFTPRNKPVTDALESSSKIANVASSAERPPVSPKPSAEHVLNPECEGTKDLLPVKLGLASSRLHAGELQSPLALDKFQQLRQTVGQRMTSLDPDWLDRCQGLKGQTEKARSENLPLQGSVSEQLSETDSPLSVQEPFPSLPGSYPMPGNLELAAPKSVPENGGDQSVGIASSAEHQRSHNALPCRSNAVSKVTDCCRSPVKDGEGSSETPENWAGRPANSDTEPRPLKSRVKRCARRPGIRRQKGQRVAQDAPSPDLRERKGAAREREGSCSPEKVGKAARKRRRDSTASQERGGDGPAGHEGAAGKRSRMKTAAGHEEPGEFRQKLKSGEFDFEEQEPSLATAGASPRLKARAHQENLLGDVEEEAMSCSVSKARGVGGPSNKNGNYVRINLKKKTHVKGYALRGNRLRKQAWKQKWQKKGEQFGGGGGGGGGRGSDACFRCGGRGHWASQCRGRVPTPCAPMLLEETAGDSEETPLPTLEEVARMTNTELQPCLTPRDRESSQEEQKVSVEGHCPLRPTYDDPVTPPAMEPFYHLAENGKPIDTTPEVRKVLSELGYRSFRAGQEVAIMRILSGLSTLVVLSTGMGKSLCYQLPAYLYAKRSKCITLVVSPLVSLMDDQVSGLPPPLKAVCIHSNMTKSQREAAVEKVKEGKVHVLLLSPEALVGGGHTGSSCLPPADQLPPVAFACIDEVHCVSEWSHNFRPCYLRLCKVLRDRLGVRCLLGLTATATLATARDVAHHLGIPEEEEEGGIAVRSAAVPSNLHLSASVDRDKDQALVSLLKGDRFGCLDSVIVYCTRREETARLAALLRTCLQGVTVRAPSASVAFEGETEHSAARRKKAAAKKKIRQPLKWIADCYHAGMSAAERRRVQNNFMSSQLRIVVATVAFGMGLDKSDVRGVVHYNMPKNFESYVQEIGRAGRDGKPAHCHLFLDPMGGDLNELRRHIYADTVDYCTIKKLVQKVFPRCKCRDIYQKEEALNRASEVDDSEMMQVLESCEGLSQLEGATQERVCYKHERAIPTEKTVEALDIREEGIETLLCYLELHPQHWVELLHPTLSCCRIVCYSGPQQLKMLGQSCPPIAVCLARERLAGVDHAHSSSVEFNVVELADSMGWEVLPVKRALRQLQWNTQFQKGFQGSGRSGVLAEFSNLSFHFRSYGDLTDDELDSVCEFLHRRVVAREKAAIYQLQTCFQAFISVAFRSCSQCSQEEDVQRSSKLKAMLMDYFEKKVAFDQNERDPQEDEEPEGLNKAKLQDCQAQIRSDIRQFLSIHQEERFSGRAIARIFHGIGSPCYPPQVYGKDRRYWRKYIHFDFNELIRLATEEIIRWK